MKLYWNIGSQPARAVKALLQMGGLAHEQIAVDLKNNQTRTPQFLEMNPLGQIPFLVTGQGTGIGESNAIMQYLCQKYPEKLQSYYGKTAMQRAKVNTILSWYQSYFRPCLFARIKIKVYGTVKKGIPHSSAQVDQADREMEGALKQLERILKQGEFVCGKELSIADLLIYFELTNLLYYDKMPLLHKFESSLGWYQRMGAIKEVQRIQENWMATVDDFKALLQTAQPTL